MVTAIPAPPFTPYGRTFAVPGRQPSHEAVIDPDSLGAVIRDARKRLGESQETFGDAVGLTQSQVSQLERGSVRTPQLDTLRRIADHTGIEAGYLLELARWPGAFRRGIPADLAAALDALDENGLDAVLVFARIVAGDDADDHGLSSSDARRIRTYARDVARRRTRPNA